MATNITIALDPHPRHELSDAKPQEPNSSTIGDKTRPGETPDDIYNIRSRSRSRSKAPSLDRRSSRLSRRSWEDEDPDLRRKEDYKQKQVFSGKLLLWLSYQSIGVIYGDIGTSPLYVYSSTFSSAPSRQDLIGVLSIIIWTLFIMVTVKYVLVILRADNDGEGGTFSTYSLLSRYGSFPKIKG
jgi:KUP system potassium uptake protein